MPARTPITEDTRPRGEAVAALYVERGGCYWDLPNVDAWDEARDARKYRGPHPVVAHPPCDRWHMLSAVNHKRWGFVINDDDGVFAAALDAVRTWGGVLEHPAQCSPCRNASTSWRSDMTPREMVAEALRDGRRWNRSFTHFRAVLSGMLRDGEVHLVAPDGSNSRYMVELTGRGWKRYFGENLLVTRLDNFADLVADGLDPANAGRVLNLTKGQTSRAWADIKNQLGSQAA